MELGGPGHTVYRFSDSEWEALAQSQRAQSGLPREGGGVFSKARRTGTERYRVAMVTCSLCGLRQTTWPL